MTTLTITVILIILAGGLIGILLGKQENEIRKLERENKNLKDSLDFAAKVVGTSNVLGVAPKDLPKDLED